MKFPHHQTRPPLSTTGRRHGVPPLALSGDVSLASCFHQIPPQLHCGFKLLLKQGDPPHEFISRCAF